MEIGGIFCLQIPYFSPLSSYLFFDVIDSIEGEAVVVVTTVRFRPMHRWPRVLHQAMWNEARMIIGEEDAAVGVVEGVAAEDAEEVEDVDEVAEVPFEGEGI